MSPVGPALRRAVLPVGHARAGHHARRPGPHGDPPGGGKNPYIAIAMTISTLANIGLDPLFIFTFGMGVAVALATTLSIAIAGIYVLFVFISGRSAAPLNLDPFTARGGMMRQIVAIGFPQSLGMLALSISFMLLNKLVSGIGRRR